MTSSHWRPPVRDLLQALVDQPVQTLVLVAVNIAPKGPDASTHDWVPGVKWDWVVTMDDATNEHYSMRWSPR